MSTNNIYQTVIRFIKENLSNYDSILHLDIGAGSGGFLKLLNNHKININSKSCDYTDSLMKLEGQKVDIVNLNESSLPYDNNSFEIVTAIEIIEHLENPRLFIRDIARVLKPGGICIISTPNILNLNSRIRNLWFGFPNLFGPLLINERIIESCSGHISPISYFYIYHAMSELEFEDITFKVDKLQRSGILKLFLLWIPIIIFSALIRIKEKNKYKTITKNNKDIVNKLNSINILLGRTIIVKARKK